MHSRLAYVAVLLAPVVLGAYGASDVPTPQGTMPVRLDVVVTGAQGHPVEGRRASDFDVREDGVRRPLTAAEFRWIHRNSPVEVRPIETRLDEEREARQPGARVFAFVLDEFHVSPGASARRARAAVASFIDDKMYERDLAAVVRPLDSVSSVRFTRDRAILHGGLAAFTGRKGDHTPRTPLEEQRIGRDPAVVRAARHRVVKAGLRDLAVRLGELNADRAVVVLVSEGFPEDSPSTDGQLSDLQSLVRGSSRFHFTIYPFNPAAPDEDVASAEDRKRGNATLKWLAAETGGVVIQANAFIAGFSRMFHDTHGYYALTFQPAHADGRFHRLEVRTRGNANVRTHTTYWATTKEESNAPAWSPPVDSVTRRVLRRSMLMDAWIGVRRDAAGNARMIVTWEPRTNQSRLAQTVLIKASTVMGTPVFEGAIGPVSRQSPAQKDSARFGVPTGRVEVDMTVLDAGGRILDTDARDVDVPDMQVTGTPGPVLLPVEIVGARTLREFRAASIDSGAPPSPGRTFPRGHQLLIRVHAFDRGGTVVRVTGRVLNRAGQPMRDLEADAGVRDDGAAQFALPLSWLAAGSYYIEISVRNANGHVAERIAFHVE
jgi:VWFA-related protein